MKVTGLRIFLVVLIVLFAILLLFSNGVLVPYYEHYP